MGCDGGGARQQRRSNPLFTDSISNPHETDLLRAAELFFLFSDSLLIAERMIWSCLSSQSQSSSPLPIVHAIKMVVTDITSIREKRERKQFMYERTIRETTVCVVLFFDRWSCGARMKQLRGSSEACLQLFCSGFDVLETRHMSI